MLSGAGEEGIQADQLAETTEKSCHGAHVDRMYVVFSDRDVVGQVCSQM
jgi:hypothetical protein